jgi:hypothetical protein
VAGAVEIGKEGRGVTRKEDGAVAARADAAIGKKNARQRQISTSRRPYSLLEMPHIFLYIMGVFCV